MITLIISKLERYLFYFLLFAIPFQTRKILWHQNWNFNEWQSASIYGTDILIIILFLFWVYRSIQNWKISNFKFPPISSRVLDKVGIIYKQFQISKSKFLNPNFYLLILVAVSVVSIKNSTSSILSAYNVLKLVEFIIFYFYIKNYAVFKFGLIGSMIALIFGGLFQAVIAILQFLKQSSIGLGLLGESVLATDLTGIASFYNLHGAHVIRAYGTTPHPNILAAYLFLTIFSFYFIYLYFHIYHHTHEAHKDDMAKGQHFMSVVVNHQGKIYHPKLNYFLLAGYAVLLSAFFFTFARVMIFLWFFGFIIRSGLVMGNKKFRKIFGVGTNKIKLIKILIISAAVVLLFGAFYWPEAISRIKISSGEEAVRLRVFYNQESLQTLSWFGVGSGNFVNWLMVKDSNLPRNFYQPVHNIYFLIYSETGILSIATFILFLVFLIKDFIISTKMEKLYHYSFLIMFSSFLFAGLFDHFLWTLQQGRLIFWLLCAGLTLFKNSDILLKHQEG